MPGAEIQTLAEHTRTVAWVSTAEKNIPRDFSLLISASSHPLPKLRCDFPDFWRLFGVPEALQDTFETLSACRAQRAREMSLMGGLLAAHSASPKPHPSKPHPCNTPRVKTEVALHFSESCAAEVALQHALFCNATVIFTPCCAATSKNLHGNIEKAVLQESGAFLTLSCGFQDPTFRLPPLGLTHNRESRIARFPESRA